MQKNIIRLTNNLQMFSKHWVVALTIFGLLLGQAYPLQAAEFTALDREGLESAEKDFLGFNIPIPLGRPPVEAAPAVKTLAVDVTAYTSSVEECDDDPFITADGSTTRDGIVATNILPFGTKIRIPAVFGNKVFEVHDRMNARYSYRVDIWMEKKDDMRQFGLKKNAAIEVVEMGDGKTQWAARAAEIKAKRLAEAGKK